MKITNISHFSGGEASYFTEGNTSFSRFVKTRRYRFKVPGEKKRRWETLTGEALDVLPGYIKEHDKNTHYPINILCITERGEMLRMSDFWNDDVAVVLRELYGLSKEDYFSMPDKFARVPKEVRDV